MGSLPRDDLGIEGFLGEFEVGWELGCGERFFEAAKGDAFRRGRPIGCCGAGDAGEFAASDEFFHVDCADLGEILVEVGEVGFEFSEVGYADLLSKVGDLVLSTWDVLVADGVEGVVVLFGEMKREFAECVCEVATPECVFVGFCR